MLIVVGADDMQRPSGKKRKKKKKKRSDTHIYIYIYIYIYVGGIFLEDIVGERFQGSVQEVDGKIKTMRDVKQVCEKWME